MSIFIKCYLWNALWAIIFQPENSPVKTINTGTFQCLTFSPFKNSAWYFLLSSVKATEKIFFGETISNYHHLHRHTTTFAHLTFTWKAKTLGNPSNRGVYTPCSSIITWKFGALSYRPIGRFVVDARAPLLVFDVITAARSITGRRKSSWRWSPKRNYF